ncbi:MAG: aminodeoxychorismate synthase component I [Alphaproteobacteria bacterium]
MAEPPHILPLPYRDPVAAFAPFAADPVAVLLVDGESSRVSYIAARPTSVIVADDAGTWLDGVRVALDPFTLLAREMAARHRPAHAHLPPFQGGAVGLFGYDLARHLERLPRPWPAEPPFPDMVVGLYDTVAAFDPVRRQAWITAPDRERAEALASAITAAPVPGPLDWDRRGLWRAETTQAAYEARVARAIAYIHAGDAFQVNLSQRFIGDLPAGLDAFGLFRRLMTLGRAPFSAWIGCGRGRRVLSASPERFLKVDAAGRVETRPIKGTRRRGTTPAEDAALAADLVASPKDQAENLMIVDLLRNDLSRVCAFGSVGVPALCRLETFTAVHHLVSVVEGRLRPDASTLDLLRSAFPGGSVTGAPKIRAMEIIAELESCRRGPYCGVLAWLDFGGTMDSSILIRTLVEADGRVTLHAGGGIVADSDPALEYEETMIKAAMPMRALDPTGAMEPL